MIVPHSTVVPGCLLALAASLPAATLQEPPAALRPPELPSVSPRLWWSTTLNLRSIERIQDYALVDGYIYALSTDGILHCLRADSGQVRWTRKVFDVQGVFYPPTACHFGENRAVVLTLAAAVVILDPETGSELKRIKLQGASSASAAVSEEAVFAAEANRRLRKYLLEDNYAPWQVMGNGPLEVGPLYLADLDVVVCGDSSGLVRGLLARDRALVFTQQFGGRPRGAIIDDYKALYLSTSDLMLHVLSRRTGNILWQYRLPRPPAGAPVVTETSVFQALVDGGVQRIGLERVKPNWLAADAVKFLAEWPQRVVVLCKDGRVALIDPGTGQPAEMLDVGELADGISNPMTDFVFLANPSGQVRCFRPAGATPTTLPAFQVPATQPTSDPITVDRPEEIRPIIITRSLTESSGSGTGIGRSSGARSSRSDRSARSSRSSRGSRGERSSGRSSRSSRRSSRLGGG
ncbi:MAG: hypothetical protein AMXMBFR13_48410 [Phycisphaerae bacterium]